VSCLGALRLVAYVVACVACSTGAAQLLPTSPSQTAAVSGRWFVDVDPAVPAVGHKAWLFFEFVPDPTAPPSTQSQISAAHMAVAARCAACGGLDVAGTAERYPTLRPQDFAHAGASTGFAVGLTFPAVGTWQLDPSGVQITVRAIDAFEPPFIHVRGTEPLPLECSRDKVADLMKRFEHAYNNGDPALLRSVVQESIDFSIAGGAVPFIAYGREKFVAGAVDRQSRGERIEITLVYVATYQGGLGLAVHAIRTAPDLPEARQKLVGKGAMWCSQHQLVHLNLGASWR